MCVLKITAGCTEVCIPVQAIGPRAVLDVPDEICFSDSVLKYSNTKTILARNIGTRVARFTFSTEKQEIRCSRDTMERFHISQFFKIVCFCPDKALILVVLNVLTGVLMLDSVQEMDWRVHFCCCKNWTLFK